MLGLYLSAFKTSTSEEGRFILFEGVLKAFLIFEEIFDENFGGEVTSKISFGGELSSAVGTWFFGTGSDMFFDALFAEPVRAFEVDGGFEELSADRADKLFVDLIERSNG